MPGNVVPGDVDGLPAHPTHLVCSQPLHVVCPEQYTQPPPAQSHRMDLMIDCQPPAMSYRRAEVLALPFKRRYEKIEIMPEVSRSLSWSNQGFPHGLRKRPVPEVAFFWLCFKCG